MISQVPDSAGLTYGFRASDAETEKLFFRNPDGLRFFYCFAFVSLFMTLLNMTGWNKNVYQVILLEGGLSFMLTIFMAYRGGHYYESWFLKFKWRFSRITKD